MDKKPLWLFWALLVAVATFGLMQWAMREAIVTREVSFSEFADALDKGELRRVTLDEDRLVGDLTAPSGQVRRLITSRVDTGLYEWLSRFHVDVQAIHHGTWMAALLSWIVPMLMFFVLWWWAGRAMAGRHDLGGVLGLGQQRAGVLVERDTGVRFGDVAGVDEAKAELCEVVEFLKNPLPFHRLGARIPKGVLLVGPPGTGKTLLARAVAGEAGVPFFSIGGSEFIEMFVGLGAARVRDLFAQARRFAPSIIFIDELDALGRTRGVALVAGHDEREQTLNQLLSEMDGFDPAQGVIVLAATNRPEILDPALLRAGRFDRQVLVDRPDRVGRRQILQVHLARIRIDPTLEVDTVASITTGFSGAELANLVNEAALHATRRGAPGVALEDFESAFERLVAGVEKRQRVIPDAEKRVVAFHELGHALVGMALNPEDPVHKVSIIPHGLGALGYTLQRPGDDRWIAGRTRLLHQIAVLLGGRASEILCLGEASTGAADDLARATEIATTMVTEYGMAPSVGLMALRARRSITFGQEWRDDLATFGPDMARRMTDAIEHLLEDGFRLATAVLEINRSLLQEGVSSLMAHETLGPAELAPLRARLKNLSFQTTPAACKRTMSSGNSASNSPSTEAVCSPRNGGAV